jgi:hypothetical protein
MQQRPRHHTAPSRLRKRDVPAVWDLFALDDRAKNAADDDDASSVASLSYAPSLGSLASEDTQQSNTGQCSALDLEMHCRARPHVCVTEPRTARFRRGPVSSQHAALYTRTSTRHTVGRPWSVPSPRFGRVWRVRVCRAVLLRENATGVRTLRTCNHDTDRMCGANATASELCPVRSCPLERTI